MTAALSPEDEVIRLRARLAERERDLAAAREMAHDAEAAMMSRLRAAQAEIAGLQRALADALAPGPFGEAESNDLAAVSPATPPDPAPVRMAAPRRPWPRAALLPAWRAMRPVARPALWRLRTFFTAEAMRELAALRAQHDQTRELLERAVEGRAAMPASPAPGTPPQYGPGLDYTPLGDTPAERWLLTLVLEGRPQPA